MSQIRFVYNCIHIVKTNCSHTQLPMNNCLKFREIYIMILQIRECVHMCTHCHTNLRTVVYGQVRKCNINFKQVGFSFCRPIRHITLTTILYTINFSGHTWQRHGYQESIISPSWSLYTHMSIRLSIKA